MKREHVLRLAHKIGDIACGNEGVVDHAHDVNTCEVCGRIADLIIDFVSPDPDPFAAPDGRLREIVDRMDRYNGSVEDASAIATRAFELRELLEAALVQAPTVCPNGVRADAG